MGGQEHRARVGHRALQRASGRLRGLLAGCHRGCPIAALIQRVIVIEAMKQVQLSGDDARLIAYGDRHLRAHVKQLDSIVSRELTPLGDLVNLEREIFDGIHDHPPAPTVEDLAEISDLDVAEVALRCRQTIELGRDDLRGAIL